MDPPVGNLQKGSIADEHGQIPSQQRTGIQVLPQRQGLETGYDYRRSPRRSWARILPAGASAEQDTDMTTIDFAKVRGILERFRGLDPGEAYYLKDEVHYDPVGPLVPDTRDVLRRAFAQTDRVLDVGCGDGRTLIDGADLFGHGSGIDECGEHMIASAIRARDAKGIRNVEFHVSKAPSLPFADETFDMVYSERGPLGHSDRTLKEALRTLRRGGLVFIETGGDFDTLGVEKKRIEKHGVRLRTLAARRHTLVFRDFYEFLTLQCSTWVYLEKELPSPDDRERFETMRADATDEKRCVSTEHRTIWIAGSKEAEVSSVADCGDAALGRTLHRDGDDVGVHCPGGR